MTTANLASYSALMRRYLPSGTRFQTTASPEFFKADQDTIKIFQARINTFLGAPGVRAAMGNMQNLEVNGIWGTAEQNFLVKLTQDRNTQAKLEQLSASTPAVGEMKKLKDDLILTSSIHLAPDSEYQGLRTQNPVMNLKLLLEETGMTRNAVSNQVAHLDINETLDWKTALATRRLAREMQVAFNHYAEFTRLPMMPEDGKFTPAMKQAMDRLLGNSEARKRIPDFDALQHQFIVYSKILPTQHSQMDAVLDANLRGYINIFARAAEEQKKQDTNLGFPDVKRVPTDSNVPVGKPEQDAMAAIAAYLATTNAETIRKKLDKLNSHEWLGLGDSKYDAIAKSGIDFAADMGAFMQEYAALKQVGSSHKPVALTPLQEAVLGAPANVIGAELAFSLLPKTQDGRPIDDRPYVYGMPMGRGFLDPTISPLMQSVSVSMTMSNLHSIIVNNLYDPSFCKYIMAQTGLSPDEMTHMKPEHPNEKMQNLISKAIAYEGFSKLGGVNPDLMAAAREISGYSTARLQEIRDTPVATFKQSLLGLAAATATPFPDDKTLSITPALANTYASSLVMLQDMISKSAGPLTQLTSRIADLPPAAQNNLLKLAEWLDGQHKGNSTNQNLFEFFKDTLKVRNGVPIMLSGTGNDPVVAVCELIGSLKGAKDKNGKPFLENNDRLIQAAEHVAGLNRGLGFMDPAQARQFQRALGGYMIKAAQPALIDYKRFINENLIDINSALPENHKIRAFAVNGDYTDAAFLKAVAALELADKDKITQLTRTGLQTRREKLHEIEPYIVARSQALETTGRTYPFKSDLQAVESYNIVMAKHGLKSLVGNKIFTNVPEFDVSNDLLGVKDRKFQAAFSYVNENIDRWLAQAVPQDVYNAVSISQAEALKMFDERRLAITDDRERTQVEIAAVARSLNVVSQLGGLTREELKDLPTGALSSGEGPVQIDETKLNINHLQSMLNLLDAKRQAAPQESRTMLETKIAGEKFNLARERGIFKKEEVLRIAMGSNEYPSAMRLPILVAGIDSPDFAQRLQSVPDGMTREQYVQELRSGLHALLDFGQAVSDPELADKITTAINQPDPQTTAAAIPASPASTRTASLTEAFSASGESPGQEIRLRNVPPSAAAQAVIDQHVDNRASLTERNPALVAATGGPNPALASNLKFNS